ncbi:hypothetical protein JCM16775_0070 [Leptotrichia hofstadii]|uniref:Uncharacterized protein n=1 Tax=Leptotrichia hofstadii TaxID=157688 RepID=A0A510JGM8_9FUSO|nr:hypothetical protein JCM16775_0070 [Leptotrichia hofstadii]
MGSFLCPKKRELVRDTEIEVVLVDATESFLKKTAEILLGKKEKAHDKGSDSGRRKGFKDTQRLVFSRERS